MGCNKIKAVYKKRNIHLVHTHLYAATIVARLATPKSVPLITTIHTNVNASDEYKKKWLIALEKFTYKLQNNIIIGVSKYALEGYYKFYNHKPYKKYLLYTFVDVDALKQPKINYQINTSTPFRLLTIGAIRYPKNQEYLVEVFKKLKDENIVLHIYGTGARHQVIKQLIEESGVNIELKGEVENASSLMSDYDVYVMPSFFEGFSLSVLEAMAMGIPMMLSNIPSFNEQCEDTACYFDLNNVDDFISKLKMLENNQAERERLAKLAKERVMKHFTLQHHLQQLRKIYKENIVA
ncbi:MAG: glycosyltransferase family 4 protein [Chitinophagaceae bacterium]|nr:glycosyltransferase family 4 protein [Chitinophagaceae bacterium]